MTRSIVLFIGIAALLSSCSQRDALVSISKSRIQDAAEIDYLSLKTGPSGEYCTAPLYVNGSEFVGYFSAYSENVPFPIVSWASLARRRGGAPNPVVLDMSCLNLPSDNSWNETLKQIGNWVGTYQTVTYPGFVEIIWADNKEAVLIRNSMKEWVPPIVFRSRYAVDYLAMWHTISGMDFKYDPVLITKSIEYDKRRLLEESAPDLPMRTESDEWPFPIGFVNFTTLEKMKTSDFMPALAESVGGLSRLVSEGWIIESFQRNKQGLNVIRNCLDRMKSDQDDTHDMEILSRIGTLALPELIREFQSVRAGSNILYEQKLVTVLSRISAPERDKALLSALRDISAGKHTDGFTNVDLIIEALMSSNCKAAIPVLEEIAASNDPSFYETRAFAKIALYALGQPIPHGGEVSILVSPKVKTALNTKVGKHAIEVLHAVLVQTGHYDSGMEILSFKKSDTGIVLSGKTVGNGIFWGLTIPVIHPDRAWVTFDYACGQLCGDGYRGKLNKRNGRWTISRWQKIFRAI
jgi:hypothetical protein